MTEPRPGTAAARRARGRPDTPARRREEARARATDRSRADRRRRSVDTDDRTTDGRVTDPAALDPGAADATDATEDGGRTPGPPAGDGEHGDATAFLLESLRDLEREHDAGDLDDADYRTLRDDYTSRAASALRAERRGAAPPAPSPPRRSAGQWALILAGIVGFAVLAGVLMAQASGERRAGEGVTGEVTQTPTQAAAECIALSSALRAGQTDTQTVLDCYRAVLDEDPENPVAHTYLGWTLYITAQQAAEVLDQEQLVDLYVEARRQVEQGAEADPGYADARAFLVILAVNEGRFAEAAAQLEVFDSLDAPADMVALVDEMRPRIDEGLAAAEDGSTTTTTTTPG